MQKRHADRQLYFNEQSITTQKYVIPFIEKHKPITADSHILEIGCGEGGNIKPFLDLGCKVTGIDINGGQIAIAKEIYSVHPNNRNLTLICEAIGGTRANGLGACCCKSAGDLRTDSAREGKPQK